MISNFSKNQHSDNYKYYVWHPDPDQQIHAVHTCIYSRPQPVWTDALLITRTNHIWSYSRFLISHMYQLTDKKHHMHQLRE